MWQQRPLRRTTEGIPRRRSVPSPPTQYSDGIKIHNTMYTMNCGPGSKQLSTKINRTVFGDIPNRRANPAQTPPIHRPRLGRTSVVAIILIPSPDLVPPTLTRDLRNFVLLAGPTRATVRAPPGPSLTFTPPGLPHLQADDRTHRQASRRHPGTVLPRSRAPVAQGIEHRPPEAGAQVRILPGAPKITDAGAAQRCGCSF